MLRDIKNDGMERWDYKIPVNLDKLKPSNMHFVPTESMESDQVGLIVPLDNGETFCLMYDATVQDIVQNFTKAYMVAMCELAKPQEEMPIIKSKHFGMEKPWTREGTVQRKTLQYLIPKPALVHLANQKGNDVAKIAAALGVSELAVYKRLKELKIV